MAEPERRGFLAPSSQASSAWIAEDLVESISAGLQCEAQSRDKIEEHHGLDSLSELALHPLIAETLSGSGFGTWPEQRYPADRREGRRNHGRRCDLMLTPDGRPPAALEGREGAPRLPFPQGAASRPVPLAEAYWMEVKTVAQHKDGGTAPDYSSRLLTQAATDVQKVASDPGLVFAGLLLIAFTADNQTARHDLETWRLRCLEKDLPLLSPALSGFAIRDRVGNTHCAVALFPILTGSDRP